jgi:O-antigen/teichoic acid export membrane protein
MARSYLAFGIGSAAGLLCLVATSKYLSAIAFVAFAGSQAVYLFTSSLVDGGYAYVMPKRISEANDDADRANWVAITVRLRLLLSALCGVIAGFASFWILPNISGGEALLVGGYAFASSLTPAWVLQGLGRTKTFLAAEAAARVTTLAWIVSFRPSGLGGLLTALSIPMIAASALLVAHNRIGMRIREGQWNDGSHHREAWALLPGLVAARIYTRAPSLLAAAILAPQVAAGFLYVERIVRAATDVLAPLNQLLLPRLVRASQISLSAARAELTGTLASSAPLFGVMLLAASLFACLSNPAAGELIPSLSVLAAAAAVSFVNSFIGLRWSVSISRAGVVSVAAARALATSAAVFALAALLRSPLVLALAVFTAEVTVYVSVMGQLRKAECSPW